MKMKTKLKSLSGSATTPCSRAVERVWIVDREDGSHFIDPADGSAWPYIKMTAEIVAVLTKSGIIKTP